MKKIVLTALMCGFVAAPAMAKDYEDRMAGMQRGADHFAEKVINKMDRNNDGVVSMDEHEAFNANMFFKVDNNNDRILSRQEITSYKQEKMSEWKGDKMHHGKMQQQRR